MANDNVIWRGNTQMNITKTESLTVMEHHANKQIDSLRKQATLLMEQVKEIQNRVDLAHLIARAKYNFKPVLMKASKLSFQSRFSELWKGDGAKF